LELHPGAAAALEAAIGSAWRGTDPAMLALCDRRIGELLGNPRYAGSPVDEAACSPAQRAHLAFTDQFVFSVADVSDAEIEALLGSGSPQQVFEFIAALHVLEMNQRMDMTLNAVL
jgi:alkylhydroperoxidase family enzyme